MSKLVGIDNTGQDMSKKTKYLHSQQYYAELYRCSQKSISRYQKLDAPLDDESTMRQWLSDRAARITNVPPPQISDEDIAQMIPGAPEALRRLARDELRAYAALEKSESDGNPQQINACRKTWHATVKELRQMDASIRLERRDNDEQIAKKDALAALGMLVYQVSESLFRAIDTLPGIREFTELEPHARRHAVRQATCDRFKVALYAYREKWPQWAFDIVDKSLGAEYFSDADLIALERQFQDVCENGPTEADHAEADRRRSDAYNALQFMDASAPNWRHYAYDENGKIKPGYVWAKCNKGFSNLVWRGPGECPEGLQPGEAIINGKVVMVDPTIESAN